MIRIDDVIDAYLTRHKNLDISRIQRAYIYSAQQHEGQLRKSGEPYMIHPIGVAKIIAEMGLDEPSICAALLHDTLEDTPTTVESLTRLFGEDVAQLVDGVTKLSKVNFTKREERQAESFRKLLVAMANDIRVLLVKLTDRLHNMRTLEHMSESARERIAEETRDIYVPLADRLGISWLQSELDDLAFKNLEPDVYAALSKRVEKTRKARTGYIQKTMKEIVDFLGAANFDVQVSGRMKNLYSIHQKMQEKGIDYESVYDAIAFRVICQALPDCYAVLGLVHARWVPIPGRFKDYIAMPKANNYQSLHTVVIGQGGERVEIQIRTDEMHRVAEYGIAAHWMYKEKQGFKDAAEEFSWLREMLENQDGVRDSREFLDSVKVDLFRDEVFVFTPKGDVKSLCRGATPLDFAYSIHTEVGHRCSGARVNGMQVPLRTKLRNGDMVEVISSKTQRPSPDWLDIVVTSRARNKVRSYLRAEERKQSKQVGQDLLEKGLRRYGCSFGKMLKQGEIDRVAGELRLGKADDLIAAVGYGKVDKGEVIDRLLPEEKKKKPPSALKEGAIEKVIRRVKGGDKGIMLDGLDNLLVRFARCCNPLPGEEVVGFVSRGRGIVVHLRDCGRAAMLDPARMTHVTWAAAAVSHRPVKLNVITNDRPGVLAALSLVFQNQKINIDSAQCQANGQSLASNVFVFMVKDRAELNRLVRSLKQSKGVLEVQRINN
jgi:guanosine-3',5'-bis(diphosphate) 3'-pyrophosphohydrolase